MRQADFDALKANLMGEVLLFGLLGKILYLELDKAWLESLIGDDVFAETPWGADQPEIRRGLELLGRWTLENHSGISEAEFKALKRDQLQLFIGTDRVLAPVWESVFFSEKRFVFQEQTLQVRAWYSRFGLQFEKINREPDDHIGVELSFVAHLASYALRAIAEDQNSVDEMLQSQRDFLSEHLLRWGPAWAKLVKQNAETDFYRGIGHLTHGALFAAAEFLKIPLPNEVSL